MFRNVLLKLVYSKPELEDLKGSDRHDCNDQETNL